MFETNLYKIKMARKDWSIWKDFFRRYSRELILVDHYCVGDEVFAEFRPTSILAWSKIKKYLTTEKNMDTKFTIEVLL